MGGRTIPIPFEMEYQADKNKHVQNLFFAFKQGPKTAKVARNICAVWHWNYFPVLRTGSSNSQTLLVLTDLFYLMRTNCMRRLKEPRQNPQVTDS